MKSIADKLSKRVVNITLATVIAVSSIATAVPFILATNVSAAPNSQYTNVGFGDLTWTADRAAPSGGYSMAPSGDTLTMNVNSALSPVPAVFYLTEGLNAELPAGNNSVKASLYIDPAWAGKPVRAGLWGVSTDGADVAWPLIEFTNAYPGVGFDGLRVWDTNTGDWYNISTPAYGSTVALEVAINPWTENYEFYVNNVLVKTYGTYGYDALKGIIFNNRNSATSNAADNYSVKWTNLQTGVRYLSAPTNLLPVSGTSTNNAGFSMSWNAVPYATKYEYRTSNSLVNPTTLGTIAYADNSSASNYILGFTTVTRGNNGTPQNQWYWQVRAGDNNGNWSSWSAISLVTTDYTAPDAPTLNGPANNSVVNGASLTQSWNASASTDVDHYVYESYNDAGKTSLRWNQTVYGLSKTATNVADSTFWWRVKAVDAAGNESAWSPLWKLTIDNDAPGAPVTTSVKPYYTKLGTPTKTLTWVAGTNSSDVAYYEYAEYYNTAPTSETTPTNWLKTPIYGTSTTDTAWGSNITIYWRVRAVDQAGNKSAWSDIGKIITDVDAPIVTVNSVASSEDTTPTVTGTTSELGGDVTINIDGSDVATVTSDASGNWSWTATTSLSVGVHAILATATDTAGNTSSTDTSTPNNYWKQFNIESPATV